MKYLASQLGLLFSEGESRQNLTALLKYFAFLVAMIAVYAVLFHFDQRVLTTQLTGETVLPTGATLLMLGNADQRQQYAEAFERAGG